MTEVAIMEATTCYVDAVFVELQGSLKQVQIQIDAPRWIPLPLSSLAGRTILAQSRPIWAAT